MIEKKDLKKISSFLWQVDSVSGIALPVPAWVFTSENMLDDVLLDKSMEQLMNVTHLPGIQKAAMAMPDVHEGYGFPIGGVAATLWPNGAISPGGIGYDINCGVRLLKSGLLSSQIENQLEDLGSAIFASIPSGVGKSGGLDISAEDLNQVLQFGAKWVVQRGFGLEEDLEKIESSGCLDNANPDSVSGRAKARGWDQLGTLGAGNHFIEIDEVEEIYDERCANAYGLFQDQAVVLVHTGSRGLGHQVATDYIKVMMSGMKKYGIKVPDRELACVPFDSEEGQHYYQAMSAAANFAWANRQTISHKLREVWKNILHTTEELSLLYDVAHNIAKIEDHEINGQIKKVIVHRKGATRAFGPGHSEIPRQYRDFGQPVIIPGSMGTASYVLAGTNVGMQLSFGSSCHGAGRRMSRSEASAKTTGEELKKSLKDRGIQVYIGSLSDLPEEAPEAYKDVEEVVDVIHQSGIAKKVARLRPLLVIKG